VLLRGAAPGKNFREGEEEQEANRPDRARRFRSGETTRTPPLLLEVAVADAMGEEEGEEKQPDVVVIFFFFFFFFSLCEELV